MVGIGLAEARRRYHRPGGSLGRRLGVGSSPSGRRTFYPQTTENGAPVRADFAIWTDIGGRKNSRWWNFFGGRNHSAWRKNFTIWNSGWWTRIHCIFAMLSHRRGQAISQCGMDSQCGIFPHSEIIPHCEIRERWQPHGGRRFFLLTMKSKPPDAPGPSPRRPKSWAP